MVVNMWTSKTLQALNAVQDALQPQSVSQFLYSVMMENEPDWNMKVVFFKTFILQRLIDKQFEQRECASSKFPITRI